MNKMEFICNGCGKYIESIEGEDRLPIPKFMIELNRLVVTTMFGEENTVKVFDIPHNKYVDFHFCSIECLTKYFVNRIFPAIMVPPKKEVENG